MPYTYRSISPETRIRNGKDFHSPIKSRNFVLTVFLGGVRVPPSVCFNIQVYNIRSRKTDTDCIEILVRKSPASRCTSSHFIFVIRFSTGRERRLLVNLLFVAPAANVLPQVSAHNTAYCRVPQVTLKRLGWPLFFSRRNLLSHTDSCFVQRSSVPFIFILNGLHYPFPALCFPLAVAMTAFVWCLETLLP